MSTANGTASVTRRASEFYLGLGWVPVPTPGGKGTQKGKVPTLDAWQTLTSDRVRAELDALFPPTLVVNLGLVLGQSSGGLLDVDLDAKEAVTAGNSMLPPTTWISGRAGKPKSHHWYVIEGVLPDTTQYRDVDRAMLVELRSTGGQTVVPPSVHSSGEPIVWHQREGRPALLAASELQQAVATVAVTAIIARHWPAVGGRHDASLALSGALLRADWSVERVRDLMTAVVQAAGDDELRDRLAAVDSTDERLRNGGEATGWPKLAEALGDKGAQVVAKVRDWLGIATGRFTFGSHATSNNEQVEGHTLGPLTLKPSKPRQTPSGKLTVPVRVYKNGQAVDQFVLSSTPNGRKEASRLLQAKAPDVAAEEVDRVITAIIAEAMERLDNPQARPAGATLRDVLMAYVKEHFGDGHLTKKGVWFPGLGRDTDRAAFLQRINNELLDACRGAADVAEGSDRYALASQVDAEMRLLYGDLLKTLPDQRPEDAPVHRVEREDLATAIIGMWTTVRSLTKTKTKEGDERTVNTSLIEQAKIMAQDKRVPLNQWQKIHPAHPAFFCRHERVAEDGQVVEESVLAMNAELSISTGVRLPDGINHWNLRKVGKKADLFREVVGATSRRGRDEKQTRVIPLSRKLTEYLLEDISGADSSGRETVNIDPELSTPGGTVNSQEAL